ncbi:hypothetical protein D6D01_08920 [Aureobasidium pullulans]|uniref:Uncharacterized protein n=1 Tax=Aureobasidium pullulans TaxID=5580 RepID=A0A4S9K6Z7_AURPU|nr:hypothetical protein D6D01_08920 [Aureobasidium pullulans]
MGSREEILGTFSYVYINHIMPPKAWQKLQSTISHAIELLGQPLATITWFDILKKDRDAIKNALTMWQHQTAKDWPTSEFRKRMLTDTMKQMMNPYAAGDHIPTPKGRKKHSVLYQKACIVTPPPSFLQGDPLKLKEVMASKNFPKNITDDFLNKIDNTWMPNVTLIDTGHLKQFLMTVGSKAMAEIDLSTNIIDQWSGFLWSKPANPTCLYDYAVDYFTKVAAALHHPKGRIRVEPILGEMDEVFEKIHLDFYPDHLNKPVLGWGESGMHLSATEDYPKIFDRVHLSNVPDYTGGTLGAFLFAAPITPQAEIVPVPSLLDRPTITAWIHGLLLKTAIPIGLSFPHLKNALQRPRDVREKGLHIVTTWQFETETKTGRFWMREDIMKQVMDRRNGWHAYIWRVDRWDIVGQPVKAATGGVKDLGISWTD